MRGGELIREARRRAGLTQVGLAELMQTTQAVIARWETGKRSPTCERVVEAIRACGFDLAVRIVSPDDDHGLLIEEALRMSPRERLDRMSQSRSSLEDLVANVRRR